MHFSLDFISRISYKTDIELFWKELYQWQMFTVAITFEVKAIMHALNDLIILIYHDYDL